MDDPPNGGSEFGLKADLSLGSPPIPLSITCSILSYASACIVPIFSESCDESRSKLKRLCLIGATIFLI